ncbi:secondary thiamine-phosphate synthase enzyme YjbQ [Roseovarius sp. SCSIO 43702]|uniref:secondary thiamine-phosphate synthase enzyme YjbQ n=1 Tax=Roseovarius sp. SCSIO 43702 TaxID=2823043 RepID=UPI001C73A1F3|nr:secondary thiamine-phosphate synthase enzyme YjbQ [Roseovarius sp. SCSIO 43702]QYX58632.1 secondary thiamine-phosphate synthase enzyme YjbQ [Roseovarius sp. SCSIO 43702]
MQEIITVETQGQGLYEITRDVAAWLSRAKVETGLLTLFIRHSSASLLIQENADPDVQHDLHAFFGRLVPPSDTPRMAYLRHTNEGPDDMPAHIKAAMMPVSLSVPVAEGRMMLGTWQGIYVFEHRDRPRRREVVAHLQGARS